MHDEDKVIVLTQPTIGVELIGIPMLESAPVQGSTENAAKSIAEEDKAMVKEQQLYPIQQFDNWWNDETDMSPFWIGVAVVLHDGFIMNSNLHTKKSQKTMTQHVMDCNNG